MSVGIRQVSEGVESGASTQVDSVEIIEKKSRGVEPRGKSLIAGYSVLTKTMIGSGLLFIPMALAHFGMVFGIIMIIASAIGTWWSLHLLAVVGLKFLNDNGSLSFLQLAKALAPKTAYLIDVSIVIMCFGCAVVYLMLIGELSFEVINVLMDNSLGEYGVLIKCLSRAVVVISLAYFALAKNLGSTKIANLVGLACTGFLVIVVVIIGLKDASEASKPSDYKESMMPSSWYAALDVIPVFLFNYHCQCNVFTVIEDTDKPKRTLKKISMMSAASVATTAFFSFIMIIPFVAYGSANTGGSILKTMSIQNNTSSLLILAKICVAVSVAISFPLQMQPLRKSVIALIRKGREFSSDGQERVWRLSVAGTAMVLAYAIACSGANVDSVVTVTGILGCHTVSFVMPLILYIKHLEKEKNTSTMVYKIALGAMVALYPICLTGFIVNKINS